MIEIGKDNVLTVARQTLNGMYLEDEEGNEVLLPNAYVIEGLRIGDKVEVFVYHDSEDRIVATTLDPLAQRDEYAYLLAKQVNAYGAFMEWGLMKDLMVPFANQAVKMEEGKSYVVFIEQDKKTSRLVGTSKINKTFQNAACDVKVGDEVDILVYSITDMGVNVVVNNKFRGLIYKNEIFQPLEIGQKCKAFIKNIREDFKIDISLQKPGYQHVEPDSQKILDVLKQKGGFLPLNDKSEPELIIKSLQMSKKTFKKSIGLLYKHRLITIEDQGIRLVNKE